MRSEESFQTENTVEKAHYELNEGSHVSQLSASSTGIVDHDGKSANTSHPDSTGDETPQ